MTVSAPEQTLDFYLRELPPGSIAFWEHYKALPRQGTVPSLQSFLDSPPFECMPWIVIADMLGPDDHKIRYFGTALADLIGKDYTDVSASVSRASGIEINAGGRGWDAINHPCGYLSRRSISRKGRPGKSEAVFHFITFALPLSRPFKEQCMVNFHSEPKLAPDQNPAGVFGHVVEPLCWIDVGAGVPATPL